MKIDNLVRAFGLILALLLGGCAAGGGGSSGPLDDVVALKASPEALPHCEVAAQRWFDAAGLVVRCDEGPGQMWAVDSIPPPYAGYTDHNSGSVVLSREYDEMWDLVATHEVGHLLRSGHPQNGSLMNAQPKGARVLISAEDLAYICEVRECPWQIAEHEAIE